MLWVDRGGTQLSDESRLLELTDEQLMVQVGQGNMQALAELVRRYQDRMLHLAFRTLGDQHLAEDVVQEAFLRVHRAAARYRPDARFGTWFYRIVVNLCMDELRKRQGQSAGLAVYPVPGPSNQDDPVHHQQVLELQLAVQKALGTLNDRERIAVILHRYDGLSHRQIAELSETSVSAVESMLFRAYRKLREELTTFSDTRPEKSQEKAGNGV